MTYRSLTEGFFQNILNSFLNVIENLGFVLGSIIFSIIGVIGYEIWNKYFGKEESYFREVSYKKWTKFYEYLFMPFIFYIFGIVMGIFGFFWYLFKCIYFRFDNSYNLHISWKTRKLLTFIFEIF
jgi:hypothetical protein